LQKLDYAGKDGKDGKAGKAINGETQANRTTVGMCVRVRQTKLL
jgi:hypothetical protein